MADSSTMTSSDDVMKEIMEQTNQLAEGGGQEEATEELAPTEEQTEEAVEEQSAETSEQTEETQQTSEAETKTETPLRIKYKGREVDIPDEKIREYVQKGYRYEEKVRELNDQFRTKGSDEPVDFAKIDEEFVSELQKSPVKTLMQFTKTILDATDRDRQQQRKVDRAIEKEFSANIPMWDAIKEDYQDYRSEGHAPNVALKLAQGDFFQSRFFDSKQKGIEEGAKKQAMKQKAQIPSGSKKAAVAGSTNLSEKDLANMTSDQLAKALGLTFVKNPGW